MEGRFIMDIKFTADDILEKDYKKKSLRLLIKQNVNTTQEN